MTEERDVSRRSFVKQTALAASAFTILRPELVRGAAKERIKAGLVGCGGRGTQAVVNMLSGDPEVELVAMGDVFADKLDASLANLRDTRYVGNNARQVAEFTKAPAEDLVASIIKRVSVDPEHKFVGFDAYQKVIGSGVDVVMLCTPPGYRPAHFEAAVEAGKHIFAEKPFATDAAGVRRVMEATRKAEQKKLTVVSGAQRHSSKDYVETVQKIHDGDLGQILALRSDYLSGPVMHAKARDPQWGDMEWQHRNWYSFIWICGDQIVEQHFHNIDFINWVMRAHPVKVVASGGAAWRPREELYGNIYDHMTSQFVYPDGTIYFSSCRQYQRPALNRVEDLVIGVKGRSTGRDLGEPGMNGLVQEHINLLRSVRGDGPYINTAMSVAESTMTAIMARESAYTGLEITWDQVMKSQQDLQPKEFGYKVPMPAAPLPVPGVYKFV